MQAKSVSAALRARLAPAPPRPLRAAGLRVHAVAAVPDGAALRALAAARSFAALDVYERLSRAWPEVTFTVRRRAGLGDAWKIVGPAPELGRWSPDVARHMEWGDGDVWRATVRLPPGEHLFKAALRSSDGATTWEAGPDRAVVVVPGSGPLVVELDVRMPGEEQGAEWVGAERVGAEPGSQAAETREEAAPVEAPAVVFAVA